ncbi:sugar phosphate isomerase/epimerase family protein [Paenibacillus sp. JX-17]|uniref:Sugar phosphate isomerase/epimerase family protein n=1 Tax=Paenibacillus lacisoli TaxID=3064525 RepID=A0ABT9C7J2_9BACL|nr:sugar phosphate isomerase/epimerase family protein [Paenibacillus sp. JX-17]MDO7905206.1 sugar phosphate isomerase/epimerase family protein [Paenibacillus sp. JX-17]
MAKVGLQLYTLRDQLEQDFEGTLRQVAELGYQGVEFHNFFGRTAEQVKSLLDELGLVALGAHVQYTRLLEHLDEEIAYHKAIGNALLIVPFLSEEQRNWEEVFSSLKELGDQCQAQGMTLAYHNHDFEFTASYGEQTVFDAMYETVPASLLKVELDTCWVHFGGYDPVEYIHKYAGRLPVIHLKDARREGEGVQTVELGQGEVDLKPIADAAIEEQVQWIVVEQDFCQNPPLQSIETSMQWIKNYITQGGQLHV